MDQVDPTFLVNQGIQMIRRSQFLLLHLVVLENLDFQQVQEALVVRQIQEVQPNQDYLDFLDCQLVQDRQVSLRFRAGPINLWILLAHSAQ